MRPLMLFAVLYVVFTQIVDFGGGHPELSGAAAAEHGAVHVLQRGDRAPAVTSLVENEGLVRKMHFPRAAIPFSTVLTPA